jgi:site-specific DNA recombinase
MDKKRLVDGTTALAEKRPRVIKIEPAERPQNVRLRVAAYTRVSSDSEDQLNSFAAQNRYYTELISGKAEWRMVTSMRTRESQELRWPRGMTSSE